jgi:hypothetical protein
MNMHQFNLLNFHNKIKHKRYGLSKLNIMDYNLDNFFFYMDFEMVQSFMMCWLQTWFWLDYIFKKLSLIFFA